MMPICDGFKDSIALRSIANLRYLFCRNAEYLHDVIVIYEFYSLKYDTVWPELLTGNTGIGLGDQYAL